MNLEIKEIVKTDNSINEIVPSKRWDYFHCFIGIHKAKIIAVEEIVAPYPSTQISGKVYVSRCTLCGKVTTKYLYLKNSL